MEFKTNVFTCCDKIYKDFIPIFILSNLYHNESCFVEIGVDDLNYEPIKKSLEILEKNFKDKFILRTVKFGPQIINGKTYSTISNTVRFFNPVTVKSDYVYISDVDIISLEKNFTDIHIKNMEKTGLPYSNIVRPVKPNTLKRLSGLHFSPYENYYPIPDFTDLCEKGFLQHDEGFLYELVKKRHNNFRYEETYRPVHGIHVSLNREPTASLGWGMDKWEKEWINFRETNIFKEIKPTFTQLIKDKISIIDNHYK